MNAEIEKQAYGIVVPLVSPIDENEKIDEAGLRNLTEYLVSGGVHGLFVLGTTGEFPRLTDGEKSRAIETVAAAARSRLPLYVGVGECGTAKVRAQIRFAERAGADFLVITLPYYYRLADEGGQLAFFRSVLDGTNLPVLLYNIPETVGAKIEIGAVRGLLGSANLEGIKDSGGDAEYFAALLELKKERPDWKVLCGTEKTALDALKAGADGLVPSLGNAFPRMTVALWEAARRGDWTAAAEIQFHVMDINRFNMKINSSLRGVIMRKKALEILGICGGRVTEPCAYPDPAVMPEFETAVKKYRVLYEERNDPKGGSRGRTDDGA